MSVPTSATVASAPANTQSHLSGSQVLITFTLAIGALSIGLILCYSAPAIESLQDRNVTHFNVTLKQVTWVAAVMPLTGIIGSILGGQLLEYAGRKWALFTVALPIAIGWSLISTAENIAMVLIGRGLTGVGLGIASVSFQVYMAETVHPVVRGSLGIFGTLAANAGIVLGFAMGMCLNWYQMAYCGLAIILPYALLVLIMLPETPRWNIRHNQQDAARKTLAWLRPRNYNIDEEFRDFLAANADNTSNQSNQFKELCKRRNFQPLFIVVGAIFSAQIVGVSCLIFYNVTIFKMAETFFDPHLSSIITGLGITLATFIPVFLSDRVGRKILLIFSGIVTCLLMGALGTFFYVKHLQVDVSHYTWVPVLCVFSIFVAFSCGYGPIPFLLMGELLPMSIRGIGASIVIMGNFLATFLTTKTFLDLVVAINIYGVFWMYSALTLFTIIFMVFCVPETKHKSLEEIQRKLSASRHKKDGGP